MTVIERASGASGDRKMAPSSLRAIPELCLSSVMPSHRRPRFVTSVYGDVRTAFSGTLWHLAQAGMAMEMIEGTFTLESKANVKLQAAAAAWKIKRILYSQCHGGYKFTKNYNDTVWRQYLKACNDTVLINTTQIYGHSFVRNYRKHGVTPCFYIDGTLTDYFYAYAAAEKQNIGDDTIQRAIELERESYSHAARIMTMSRSCMRTLVETYGVPREKIALVIPGANINDAMVPAPSPGMGWRSGEFTLGFVGLYPVRKGLDKLAGALKILRSRGAPVRLRVVGKCPPEIAALDGVDFMGMIPKAADGGRTFLKAIGEVDLGCQLSRADLCPIAVLEFLRLGIPVLATNVGGVPDVLQPGGGAVVKAEITPEELAEEISAIMDDTARYGALKSQAAERAPWASWRRAVRDMDAAINDLN